jgi:hypothetical protein
MPFLDGLERRQSERQWAGLGERVVRELAGGH